MKECYQLVAILMQRLDGALDAFQWTRAINVAIPEDGVTQTKLLTLDFSRIAPQLDHGYLDSPSA